MTTPSDLSQPSAPLGHCKAQRREIYLGTLPVQVFLLSEGDYCLAQSEVAAVIGKVDASIFEFLNSKSFKALLGAEFESLISVEPVAVEGSNKPIKPLSFHVAGLYWYHWSQKRNKSGQALCQALIRHSLQELADDAFGKKRSTEEKRRFLEEQLNQPSLPTANSASAPSEELWTAAQQIMQLSQQNAHLTAEILAWKEIFARRKEAQLTRLLQSDLISEGGQSCYPINSTAHLIADILYLPSGRAGLDWILRHPEIVGQQSEWETFTLSALVPKLPRETILELIRLAQAEATSSPTNNN